MKIAFENTILQGEFGIAETLLTKTRKVPFKKNHLELTLKQDLSHVMYMFEQMGAVGRANRNIWEPTVCSSIGIARKRKDHQTY